MIGYVVIRLKGEKVKVFRKFIVYGFLLIGTLSHC